MWWNYIWRPTQAQTSLFFYRTNQCKHGTTQEGMTGIMFNIFWNWMPALWKAFFMMCWSAMLFPVWQQRSHIFTSPLHLSKWFSLSLSFFIYFLCFPLLLSPLPFFTSLLSFPLPSFFILLSFFIPLFSLLLPLSFSELFVSFLGQAGWFSSRAVCSVKNFLSWVP